VPRSRPLTAPATSSTTSGSVSSRVPRRGSSPGPRPRTPAGWAAVGAAVAFPDGRRLFFDNAGKKCVSSTDFDAERHTALKFGTIANSFTDPETARVTAAFETPAPKPKRTKGKGKGKGKEKETAEEGAVYLVNGGEFVRYSDGLGDFVDAGYPKGGGAKALLEDLGFTRVAANLKDVAIEAGALVGSVIHLATANVEVLECDMSSMKLTRTSADEFRYTAAYVNGEGELQTYGDEEARYDAALVTGGQFFAFRGGQFIRRTSVPAGFGNVSWRGHVPIGDRFGRIRNAIGATGVVDAALLEGNHLFLCSGKEYARFTVDEGDVRDFIDPGYPKPLADNPDKLPEWEAIGAAFRAPDRKRYFFQRDGGNFTTDDRLDSSKAISGFWGRFRNRLTDAGVVSAAYVDGDKLYLVSGREYYRYTLDPETGKPGRFIDEGYPKAVPIDEHEEVTAAFTVDESVYLFTHRSFERYWYWWWWRPSEHRYAKIAAGSEPDRVRHTELVRGSFGNLIGSLVDGFDAAINLAAPSTGSRSTQRPTLRILKGRQFVEFGLGNDDSRPYEIADGPFDVIRLTTSTGYVLNQQLFSGGLPRLLSTETQQVDERPRFDPKASAPTVIRYDASKIRHRPVDSHLDFASANGIYYWEIFFHAPFLIAQALNSAQRFEDAKRWYEYVYDPTEPGRYWTFLPFLNIDVEALVHTAGALLDDLDEASASTKSVRQLLEPVMKRVAGLEEEFRGQRPLSDDDREYLTSRVPRAQKTARVEKPAATLNSTMADARAAISKLAGGDGASALAEQLDELTYSFQRLGDRYELLETQDAQILTYLDDPFDPHAVAMLRRIAYRKAIVMAYVDNLLDWGDQLFRRYSIESLSEARMLYVLAYDLLGTAPESLGTKVLPPTRTYGGDEDDRGLRNPTTDYDLLLELERELDSRTALDPAELSFEPTVHDSVVDSYFYIPANDVFFEYWDRVEDRLYKIRNCLNILGVAQPLPLFQPPLDPMAIVQAVAGGAGVGAAAAAGVPSIPHYRFSFMLAKARELTQKTAQYGNELLANLEKRDAEELSTMQYRQEATILAMTRSIREAQIEDVDATLESLRLSQQDATARAAHYQRLIDAGMLSSEITQRDLMVAGAAMQYATVVLKALAGVMYIIPEVTVGLFSFGAETGGVHAGDALNSAGDGLQTLGEALSMTGEAIGLTAAHERSKEDWTLQQQTAESEEQQIGAQIRGAEAQLRAARQELAVLEREIEHNEDLVAFMRDKFTNQQLYQWMAGRLSATYFQTFQLAHDLARYAEQAYRYERGMPAADVQFVQGAHWDGQRKGLLAGESLGLDIDRMEQSFIETAERRLEISRNISLVELDPVAFLELVRTGSCEFRLPESLFDADFPGHYCRQLKTVALSFELEGKGGQPLATLTQLSHQTVVEPSAKAVKFLLKPDGSAPLSIRSDWRPMQQIALSHVDEYEKNNGLFELRFDDDQYLPFEGTGAVSAWRLALNGRRSQFDPRRLRDIVVNVKYTAVDGGDEFGRTVKGMLKPALTGELVDLAQRFPTEWDQFVADPDAVLTVNMRQELLPDITSSKIEALFAHFVTADDPAGSGGEPGRHSVVVNDDDSLTLKQNQLTETPGLTVGRSGSTWTLRYVGGKESLTTIQLVVVYKAAGS